MKGLGYVAFAGGMHVIFALGLPALPAAADGGSSDEYRLTLASHQTVHGDFTGFGELGFYWNPERDYETYTVLWPGFIYSAATWVQISGGLRTLYTDDKHRAESIELRPFGGLKLFLPNSLQWSIYNHTRYEFRDTQNRDTFAWTEESRIRSRFGLEVPLTGREQAWQPHSWYALASLEPFYRFDEDTVDPLQIRAGIAHILGDGIHLELIYNAQLSRPSGGGALALSENIFTLNVKIGLHHGLLRRLQIPNHDD